MPQERGVDAVASLWRAHAKDGAVEPATLAWVLTSVPVDPSHLLLLHIDGGSSVLRACLDPETMPVDAAELDVSVGTAVTGAAGGDLVGGDHVDRTRPGGRATSGRRR